MDERLRASDLVKIICNTKFVRRETWTERVGPMSGDAHSFVDQYEDEERSRDIYDSVNSWTKRRKARRQLKKIYNQTEDKDLKNLCRQGISHYRVTINPTAMGCEIILSAAIAASFGIVGYSVYKIIENYL